MANDTFRTMCISAALLLCSATPAIGATPTNPLNDTGQTKCYDGSDNLVACTAANTGDSATYPRQDGRFGRDAQAALNQLTKTGGGEAGFDFTALDASGNTTTPSDHQCVKDNVTGLIWSTETLGSKDWNMGMAAGSSYNRCGFSSGWRLPTRRELLSIVNNDKSNPAIDTTYFPNTQSSGYWSSDPHEPNSGNA